MSLPSSMADFVPCDRSLQKAYCDLTFDLDCYNDYFGLSMRIRLGGQKYSSSHAQYLNLPIVDNVSHSLLSSDNTKRDLSTLL